MQSALLRISAATPSHGIAGFLLIVWCMQGLVGGLTLLWLVQGVASGAAASLLLRPPSTTTSDELEVLRGIVDIIPHRVFWKDKESRYVGCNRAFANDAGAASPRDLEGKNDFDMSWSREESEFYRKCDRETMAGGKALLDIEETQLQPDGRRAVLLTSKVPLFDKNGEVDGILGMYVDITERKEMEDELDRARERAEAASEAKSAFLANMSHEIRTPLNGVLGMLDLVLDETLPADVRGRLLTAQRSGQSTLEIINDILDISKIEAGGMTIEPNVFDLPVVLRDLRDLFRPLAEGQGIALEVILDSPIPQRLVADSVRLRQCLVNLLGNALKFTRQGSITLRVGVEDEQLVLQVVDTGIGIPEDRIDQVFEGFEQAHGAISACGGTGLGLSICKRLASLMGGSLTVKSTVDVGSNFMLRVPCDADGSAFVETLAGARDARGSVATPKLSGRLLVVDDNPVNLLVAKGMLDKTGMHIDMARDGLEALEAIRAGHYDMVFTDVHMPRMDGLTLVKSLRKEGFRMPVVALTAGVMTADRAKAFEAGCDDFLCKPVVRAKLYAALEEHMAALV